MTISKYLRAELKKDDRAIYRISKLTGIDRSILKRFMDKERTITLDTADKLTEFYNLKLVKK